jgi:hypothetical protein
VFTRARNGHKSPMTQDPYAAPDDARTPQAVTPSNPSPAGEWGVPPRGSPESSPDSPRKYRIGAAVWLAIAFGIFAVIIFFAVAW